MKRTSPKTCVARGDCRCDICTEQRINRQRKEAAERNGMRPAALPRTLPISKHVNKPKPEGKAE
jgi:hypothetical protein